ncbi:uncharacterized protein LOC129566110 [Sitodiplosis mosellana]|uniref:uncharacterized protein LOC129566110 n=1 Tax=Sitodiplosis mosellana TaxID=263140 RepID=UPI0024452519|nr:uncharacterized protein LOC129566110 [Sitodiplosis mosellana]
MKFVICAFLLAVASTTASPSTTALPPNNVLQGAKPVLQSIFGSIEYLTGEKPTDLCNNLILLVKAESAVLQQRLEVLDNFGVINPEILELTTDYISDLKAILLKLLTNACELANANF